TTLTCPFGDSTNHVLTVTATDHSIAGTTFTATATHRPDTTVMQVLGAGPTMLIGATATSLARRPGTNGAAVQTLSPSCTSSLTFSGAGTANIVGDVWSNGNISGGGSSTGSVTGNVVGVCSNPAPPFLPNPWTVSGSQVSGGGQTGTRSKPASAGAVSLSVVKQTVAATVPDGSLVSFRALPQFWDSAAACAGSFDVDAVGNTNNLAGTWSVEVTSVRWEPYTCRGQAVATPSCFIRESAPS